MRFYITLCLGLLVSFATIAQDETPAPIPASFAEAYQGAKNAAAEGDNHLLTHYTEQTFHLYIKEYGIDLVNTPKLLVAWLRAYSQHSGRHSNPFESNKNLIKDLETQIDSKEMLSDLYLSLGKIYMSQTLENLNDYKQKSKYSKLSKTYLEKAVDVLPTSTHQERYKHAKTALEISALFYEENALLQASEYLEIAAQFFKNNGERYPIDLAEINFWEAKTYLTKKSYKNAQSKMLSALNLLEKNDPTSNYALSAHAFMVEILENQGKSDEATKHCQAIGRLNESMPDKEFLPLFRAAQKYPYQALKNDISGFALVEFSIDEQGMVKDAKVVDGENVKYFEESSIAAAEKYRYAPRYEDGKPVRVTGIQIRLEYKMFPR